MGKNVSDYSLIYFLACKVVIVSCRFWSEVVLLHNL